MVRGKYLREDRRPHSAVGKHLIKWTGAFRSRIGDKVMKILLTQISSYLAPCVSNRTLVLNHGIIALLVAGVLLSSAALAQLPDPGMVVDPGNTALVITDPQNDFLSPEGVTWGVVGESVTRNNTVENLENLL